MKAEANIERELGPGATETFYGTLTLGQVIVRERIPNEVVHKWELSEQENYYRGVLLRLQKQMKEVMATASYVDKRSSATLPMNRHERRARDWAIAHPTGMRAKHGS